MSVCHGLSEAAALLLFLSISALLKSTQERERVIGWRWEREDVKTNKDNARFGCKNENTQDSYGTVSVNAVFEGIYSVALGSK